MSLADEPFSLLAMLIVDEKQLLKDFRHFFQLAFDWNWFHSVEVKEKREKKPRIIDFRPMLHPQIRQSLNFSEINHQQSLLTDHNFAELSVWPFLWRKIGHRRLAFIVFDFFLRINSFREVCNLNTTRCAKRAWWPNIMQCRSTAVHTRQNNTKQ
jgi:hypothetical protein